jgi:exonuclease V gamma subunit
VVVTREFLQQVRDYILVLKSKLDAYDPAIFEVFDPQAEERRIIQHREARVASADADDAKMRTLHVFETTRERIEGKAARGVL